jgi:hypothetical protein
MAVYSREYLQMGVSDELIRFLKFDFGTLKKQCGDVVGLRIAIPRLIPLDKVA